MWRSGLVCIYTLYFYWFAASHFGRIVAEDVHPPLTISMILRDFKAYNDNMGHPDFNNQLGDEKGIPERYLTFDKKPAYNTSKLSTTTTHGQTWFNRWYRDSEYCIEMRDHITLTWDTTKKKYVYYNDSFFPLDGRGWGNEGRDGNGKIHNFGFTAEFATYFTYQGTEVFSFSGDDDVWVYINDYRIIDLGGVHTTETQTVALSQFESAASLKKGSRYNFNFFFAERHEVSSVFHIETSVSLQDCPVADACGVCNGTAVVNLCIGVSCGHGTCDCHTGCCKCAEGWSQATTCGNCTSYCGNGHIEAGEQCDVGTTTTTSNKDSPCCDKYCRFVDSGAPCSQTSDVCKSNACDGAGHCSSTFSRNNTCVPNNPSLCVQGMCDGTGTCGIPLAAGAVCDMATKPCTQMVCGANGACGEIQMKDGTNCEGGYAVGDCVQWQCRTGQCVPAPKKQGLTCPGLGLCSSGSCDSSGNCIISQNLTQCQTTNPCAAPIGSCDPQTGRCVFQQLNDGSSCSLPNRKDCANYICQQGSCVPQSVCTPTSCDYHPKCNLTTGNCEYASSPGGCCGNGIKEGIEFCDDAAEGCCIECDLYANEGEPCIDNNPCSRSTCDGTGKCVAHPLPTGTSCGNSGNPCTHLVCQGHGVCTEVPQAAGVICGAGGDCTKATCNGAGICTTSAKPDNTACDVNNTYDCTTRICKKGVCNSVHVADGTGCGSNACGALACTFGVCSAGPNYKSCPTNDSCHADGVCDPQTGNCSSPSLPDGQSCPVPSQSSCQIWSCTSGKCNASCVVTLPFCGNGVVELDEDCDGNSSSTCCEACKFAPAGSKCSTDNKQCTEDVCDSKGVCQHNHKPGCSFSAKVSTPSLIQLFILLGISLLLVQVEVL